MTYCTINPANERLLQEFAEQNDVQVGEILTRANTAFRDDWSRRPLRDRRIVLKTAASFLRQDREHFARLVTLDMGKRLDEARPRSISVLTSQLLRRPRCDVSRSRDPRHGRGRRLGREGPAWCDLLHRAPALPYYQLARVAWKEK
jgi:succinate-semialdehyde dehydrogenase / glutarate-semialdehyde dehydrogenase